MAQMPASYLDEKIDDLRARLARIDKSSGLIELTPDNRRHLAELLLTANAIVNEIAEWTAEASA